jgi:hypothetical protein
VCVRQQHVAPLRSIGRANGDSSAGAANGEQRR